MSKRVEEKAIDAWAIYEYREHPKGLYHTCFVDGYKEGYEQAEQDNALTAEDIGLIAKIRDEVMAEAGGLPSDFNNETLRRYEELKARKEE